MLWLAHAPAATADTVLHAGTLLDGQTDTPRTRVSVIIHDGRIARIESGYSAPPGAEIIDLSSATVMSGFIDCHVHIGALLPGKTNATEYQMTHSDIDRAFDGALFARQLLQQGFTSARDAGGGPDTAAIRDAIEAGKISGPRLWVSLEPLSPSAGHGDLSTPGWSTCTLFTQAATGDPECLA